MVAIDDPNFFKGAGFAIILMVFLMFYAAYMRARGLYASHRLETPIKLGRHFYYIVTEHEWNQVTLARLQKKQNVDTPADPEDDGTGPCLMFTTRHGQRQFWNGTSYAEHASRAKFFPNKTAAMRDHDQFRLVYPLDKPRTITILSIAALDTDNLGKTKLLELAEAQLSPKEETPA
jgi:hypothetical protein